MKIQINPMGLVAQHVLYHNETLELKPGITILVGRNGAGKTSLIRYLEYESKKGEFNFRSFDNYSDGGQNAIQRVLEYGKVEDFFEQATGSEGMRIFTNFGKFIEDFGCFMRNYDRSKPLIVCLDAVDSGLDIEGLEQVKSGLDFILEHEKGTEIYFLVSANNYALVEGSSCLDIYDFSYRTFASYIEYKEFILEQYKRDRLAEAEEIKHKKECFSDGSGRHNGLKPHGR